MTQIIKKVWYIVDEVSGYDLDTLLRSNVSFSILRDEYPIDTVEFHTYQYAVGRTEVRITTHDEKQESWLKLCFGNRLEHFSTCYEDRY